MRARRSLWSALAAAVACTVLAACGAGQDTPGATAAAVPCDFTPPATKTTINVLAYNSSAIDAFTNTMVKSCTKDNVTVRHDPIDYGGQYTKTPITLAAPTGTYDVVEGYSAIIALYASKKQILPLDDLFAKYKDKYDLGGLDPQMLQGMSYDGHLYGLPMQANLGLMVYRKDIFDNLGLTVPTTYAELVDDAKKIQDSGEMKYPIAMPGSDPNTAYEQTLGSFGMSYVDTSTNTPTFDTPQAKQALQALVDLNPYMDPQVSTFDQPKVQQQLYNGKAAIAIMFSGRMADLIDPANSAYSSDFAFAPPPATATGEKVGSSFSVDGWMLAANSKVDPDLMFQVIASSVTKEASIAAMPAAYPARTSVVTPELLPYADAIQATISGGALLPPPYPWFGPMEDASWDPLTKGWAGDLSVDEALSTAQTAANDALASMK